MDGMHQRGHVFVGLSGGVDSAVSAACLLDEGYQITTIFMQTWKDPDCEAAKQSQSSSLALAQKAADFLGIPFIVVDLQDHFFKVVVKSFIQQYLDGKTPNPCLICNPQIKWGILQTYALAHGAEFFATGHYAQIERLDSGQVQLLRGVDQKKDQSYVLSLLSQSQLRQTLLPLGGMTKVEVRKRASDLGLPAADREESQDLCFLGGRDYRNFLRRFAPGADQPGDIVDLQGKVIGTHQGLPYYTVGQRKGIRVAASAPYYVLDKDVQHNRLVVGFANQAGADHLSAEHANWIAGEPPEVGDTFDVMVRYRTKPVPAILSSANHRVFRLEFMEAVHGISPGQVAALYQGDVCLGGGFIQTVT